MTTHIDITERDQQRILAIQDKLSLGNQQDTMRLILDVANTALSLADELECRPIELARYVSALRTRLAQRENEKSDRPTNAGSHLEKGYFYEANKQVTKLVARITQYNDQQANDNSERWFIDQTTIGHFIPVDRRCLESILSSMAAELLQHHKRYGLRGKTANQGKDINRLKAALIQAEK